MSNIKNPPILIPAADFQRLGRCPVDLRWLIFNQKEFLQEAGAIIRFGKRRWLVDESKLIDWIRENGESFSTVSRKKLMMHSEERR